MGFDPSIRGISPNRSVEAKMPVKAEIPADIAVAKRGKLETHIAETFASLCDPSNLIEMTKKFPVDPEMLKSLIPLVATLGSDLVSVEGAKSAVKQLTEKKVELQNTLVEKTLARDEIKETQDTLALFAELPGFYEDHEDDASNAEPDVFVTNASTKEITVAPDVVQKLVLADIGISAEDVQIMSRPELYLALAKVEQQQVIVLTNDIQTISNEIDQIDTKLHILNQVLAQFKANEKGAKVDKEESDDDKAVSRREKMNDSINSPKGEKSATSGIASAMRKIVDRFIALATLEASSPGAADRKAERQEQEKDRIHQQRESQYQRKELLADYRDTEWKDQEQEINILMGKFSELKISDYSTVSTDRIMEQVRADVEELNGMVSKLPSAAKEAIDPALKATITRMENGAVAEMNNRAQLGALLYSKNGDPFFPKIFTGDEGIDKFMELILARAVLQKDLNAVHHDGPLAKQSRAQKEAAIAEIDQALQ